MTDKPTPPDNKDSNPFDRNIPATFSAAEVMKAEEEYLKNRWLSAFSEHGANISKACAYCGVDRWRVNQWLSRDPDFATRKDAVVQERLDRLEDNLFDIAEDVSAPAGARVSASLKLLEAYRPEVYKPGVETGTARPQITMNFYKKPDKETKSAKQIDAEASDVK